MLISAESKPVRQHWQKWNLSNYQRSVLALELEDVFSKKAKERMLSGNPVLKSEQGTRTDTTSVRNLTNVDTKKELSKVADTKQA